MVMFGPQLLLRQELEKFLPAIDQGFEALLRSRWHGCGRGLKDLAVTCQEGGVDPVGFGEQTAGASKVTDLAWVDQSEGDLRLVEGFQKRVFIAPGGFANHVDRAGVATDGL